MINSLSVQLEKQAEIKKQRQNIESELSEYINQKNIFDKIKDSLTYRFEVDKIVTNKYITALNLSLDYDNSYFFYIPALFSSLQLYLKVICSKDSFYFPVHLLIFLFQESRFLLPELV